MSSGENGGSGYWVGLVGGLEVSQIGGRGYCWVGLVGGLEVRLVVVVGLLGGIDVGEAVHMGAAGSGGSDHFCNDVYLHQCY